MNKLTYLIVSLLVVASVSECAEYWIEDDRGNAIGDASIYVVYSDGTYEKTNTRRSGFEKISPKRSEKVTVLIGGKGIKGQIIKEYNSFDDLKLKIQHIGGGSTVFDNGTGELPGIKGVLNPILDHLDRTYMYGRDISINNGATQPVNFKIDEKLVLKDNNNKTIDVMVRFIQRRVILLDYSEIKEGS